MQPDKPLVTINVVTSNRRDKLLAAIESAYAQNYRPVELVVVDNNSTDGSPEAVEQRWPDAKVIRIHRNIGCQPGRNVGMKNARGKYIFNLDDDGILHPEAIERVVEVFEAQPEVAIVCVATPPLEHQGQPIPNGQLPRYCGNFRSGASAIRTSALASAGYFPEYPRAGSEIYLAAKMLNKDYEILYLPSAAMYHPADRSVNRDVMLAHAYYAGWHNLKTAWQIRPFPDFLAMGFWGIIRGMQYWGRYRCLWQYLRGVGRFFFDLPDVLANRSPVSRRAFQKQFFLVFNTVTDARLARDFQGYSTRRHLADRWRLWRSRKKPKPSGEKPA